MKLQIPLIKWTAAELAVLQYCSPEKACKIIVCDSFILDKDSAIEFHLLGEVQFKDLNQHAAVRSNNTHRQNTPHIYCGKSWIFH